MWLFRLMKEGMGNLVGSVDKSSENQKVDFRDLESYLQVIFARYCSNGDIVNYLSKSFVSADLVGHHSHGISSVFPCLNMTREGRIDPNAFPCVANDNSVGIWVDGNNGYGRYAAKWAMERAIEKSKKNGSSLAWIRNCSNTGRLGEYVEQAAQHGCLGIAMTGFGNGKKGAIVSPPGCIGRFFGTNPIAFSIPTAEEPIVIDMSLAKKTYHHIEAAHELGKLLDDKSILDKKGNMTNTPETLFQGGSIAMAEGYKGLCISLIITLLSGIANIDSSSASLDGTCFLVIDTTKIPNFAVYREQIMRFIADYRHLETIDSTPTRLPGDQSQATREYYKSHGIPINYKLLNKLKELVIEDSYTGMISR